MGRWLTIEEKRKLIQRSQAEPGLTQKELSEWAAGEFKLSKPPARNTVSDILKKASTIMDKAYGSGKRRKPLKVTSLALENELSDWVGKVEGKKVSLNRQILTLKAQQIQAEVGGAALGLGLSVGWLSAFMRRHNLRFRIKRGEAGSVDPSVVCEGRRALQELIDLYTLCDVFNMDECALFFAQAPARDICTPTKPGVKQDKTRITLLVCANADGTETLPVLFIGRAARPRCFRGKTGADLGYDYKNNKNAWLTSAFFQQWLRQLDGKMRWEGRTVLLILDNASSHASGDMALTNVRIAKLPPNTTPCLQPLDAGVIASFKARYRGRQMAKAIDRIENDEDVEGNKAYKIDQLTAMQWSADLWDDTSATTIRRCWRHTGLVLPLDDDESATQRPGVEPDNCDSVVQHLVDLANLMSM